MDQAGRIRVILVTADARERATLARGLEAHERIDLVAVGQTGREALQLANRSKPDVMVMDAVLPGLGGLEVAALVAKSLPGIGLVVLGADESVDNVRHAMRCGVRALLTKPVWVEDLLGAILDNGSRSAGALAAGMGVVWAFGGTKGAAGSTTLAVNAAVALAVRHQRVVLVDLDRLDGDCGFYLDMLLRPGEETAFGLLCGSEELIASDVQRRVRSYDLGRECDWVLHLIDSPGRQLAIEHIPEERFSSFLDILRVLYDVVIVDLPASQLLEFPAAQVIDNAERLTLVSNTDIRSLKALAVITRTLHQAGLPDSKVELLLSGLLSQPGFEAHRWVEERRAELGCVLDVPVDREACGRAVMRGIPVVLDAPQSAFTRFVNGFVEQRACDPSATPGRVVPGSWSFAGMWRQLHHLVDRVL